MTRAINEVNAGELVNAVVETEADVQRLSNRFLRDRGWEVVVFATDKRKRRQERGWFDAVAKKRGRTLWLEYKAPGGQVRPAQAALHARWQPHLNDWEALVVAEHPIVVVVTTNELEAGMANDDS